MKTGQKPFPMLIGEPKIAQHQIGATARKFGKPRPGRRRAAHLEPILLERGFQPSAFVLPLVDDEHARLHRRRSPTAGPREEIRIERNEAICGECRMTLAYPETAGVSDQFVANATPLESVTQAFRKCDPMAGNRPLNPPRGGRWPRRLRNAPSGAWRRSAPPYPASEP